MTIYCIRCGEGDLPDDAAFCRRCGASMSTSASQPAQPAPQNTLQQLLDEGQTRLKAAQFTEALSLFEMVIRLDASNSRGYVGKGDALNGLQRYEEAITAFERAITLEPGYASSHCNKGFALFYLKRYEEALVAFDRAIQLNPNDASAYTNKGSALRNLQRYEEALAAFNRAIQINPNSVGAYMGKGNTLNDLHRSEEAQAAHQRADQLKQKTTATQGAPRLSAGPQPGWSALAAPQSIQSTSMHTNNGGAGLRKWVRFGAVSTLIFCILMVGGGLFINNLTSAERLFAFLFFVPVGIGCFYLFKNFGVWDRTAWATMSDGRKTLLFLVTLPGALFAAVTVGIIVLAVSAFLGGMGDIARTEVRDARRAELRSDIKTAVHKEFKKHGF